jgi:hypothetical protein
MFTTFRSMTDFFSQGRLEQSAVFEAGGRKTREVGGRGTEEERFT